MVKSLVNTTNRLSKIIDISGIPLAAFEYQETMNRVFITSGLRKLLNLTDPVYDEILMDADLFYEKIQQIMSDPVEMEEYVYPIDDGRYVRIHLKKDKNGYMGVVTDATKNVLIKQQMQYENNHDKLTGLCCYSYFKEQAAHKLRKASPDKMFAIVMMDLDFFKTIVERNRD